jgi:hypothetical protein
VTPGRACPALVAAVGAVLMVMCGAVAVWAGPTLMHTEQRRTDPSTAVGGPASGLCTCSAATLIGPARSHAPDDERMPPRRRHHVVPPPLHAESASRTGQRLAAASGLVLSHATGDGDGLGDDEDSGGGGAAGAGQGKPVSVDPAPLWWFVPAPVIDVPHQDRSPVSLIALAALACTTGLVLIHRSRPTPSSTPETHRRAGPR